MKKMEVPQMDHSNTFYATHTVCADKTENSQLMKKMEAPNMDPVVMRDISQVWDGLSLRVSGIIFTVGWLCYSTG